MRFNTLAFPFDQRCENVTYIFIFIIPNDYIISLGGKHTSIATTYILEKF